MRLYTRTGATALDHGKFGHFDADEQGGFNFPDELSDELHRQHSRGRPNWETDVERQRRLMQEELDRRRDPASLYEAVAQLMLAAKGSGAVSAVPEPPSVVPAEVPAVKAPRARKSAAAKTAAGE